MMEINIKIAGVLLILLALFHVAFPAYFKWREQLSSLDLLHRQMMKTHTFFIALTVFLMGILCVISSNDLYHTNLGKSVLFGFAIFWTIRLILQWFGYSNKLWKSKKFETRVHFFFTFLWLYLSITFWAACLTN